MTIKRGSFVSHSKAIQWGIGKVMEISDLKATIQFSDGITRKIASSHYWILQLADPASFVPIPEGVPATVRTPAQKKVKKPAA